ncbi:hypothetical protein HCN44_004475 [Aphidius gifuensis]|uniref:NADH dehydrogenase [ubiquinone] 1 alpha subcomplex subunit 10, mitochondrial n=1 Tax=Aphidius gifuensis TaxID=684658 RepID=A0A834XZ81_APHGI|nr:NADH dehydrogenase [ubiquinone] 1 alpha subcomplex subunit 10, mitochondrial [Aphidius gifuensis]XP_044003032.1 NADH dehydrogenase [ubiquinone] 1 alpha subcomplex subunit 10, mitochondrial [Aphidius gifuensis]XP_044003033.1 NADH dehydrogenase [ubiquinone] 1 alpha subcomplex subunit 10, mitochondrial [Aphidius gifuensis]KAF7995003.1 hypothetical protein HCN44_004475 [Aphidius gifuensis]
MAVLLRLGHSKLSPCGAITGLCKSVKKTSVNINQIAWITGKALRDDRPPRPAPFDWKNKSYAFWHVWTDAMIERMDDNSKIVIVEGLPAVGKEKFAMQLADELEMLYMPTPTFDDYHIDPTGFDYRTFNPKLPDDAKFYDDKMFHANPKGLLSASIQMGYYFLRFSAYIDALTHVLSTGQGVVLQRSPWSDVVFAKSMLTQGYMSPGAYDYYKSSLANSLHRLLRPHLVIYLDIPAEKSLENIMKRGRPHEKNSKGVTLNFLKDVENNYKKIHLPTIASHAHMLIYDWSEEGEMDFVIDDIESLKFEGYGREDSKMEDWRFSSIDWMRAYRDIYHNQKMELMQTMIISRLDVPELLMSAKSIDIFRELQDELFEKRPGSKWADGYDPATNNIWFKTTFSRESYPSRAKLIEGSK